MENRLLTLLFLTMIIMGTGIMSCDIGDCGSNPQFFKVTGMEGRVYQVEYRLDANNNFILDDVLTLDEINGIRIPFDQFSIGILPEIESYGWRDKSWDFGLIQTVNACSPNLPKSEEKIDRIVITANQDFNSEYLQGADLSEIFDIIVYDEFNNFYNEKFDLNTFLATEPIVPNESILLLKEKPDTTTSFQFKVEYYQQGIDFDFFEFTTTNVVVE